jgi:phage shock protein C
MGKRLTRSRNHKIIGGVCGGLGEYFGIDPIIFRFVFFALLMAGGSSFLIYLILLMVIPKEPLFRTEIVNRQATPERDDDGFPDTDLRREEDDSSSRLVIGLLLIAAGVLILLYNLVPYFRLEKLWPVILIIIGLGLLFQRGKRSKTTDTKDKDQQI